MFSRLRRALVVGVVLGVCAAAAQASDVMVPLQGVRIGRVVYHRETPKRDVALEKAIVKAMEVPDGQEVDYLYARVDLDGKGPHQTLVLLGGSYFCGTGGCSALVFDGGTRYRVVTRFTLMRSPWLVTATRSHGWRDIAVRVSGGGVRAHYTLLRFDGKTYPHNPSTPPALGAGTVLSGDAYLVEDEKAPNYGYLRFTAGK